MNRRRFMSRSFSLPLGALLADAASAQQAAPPPAVQETGPLAGLTPLAPDHPLQASWQAWKALCLSADGRVIDGYQQNASHSEGQGYGLVLAAFFGDAQAASGIIRWTEANLTLRDDQLLAWRWLPNAVPHVADRNNASDGDLFYAWGLLLSAPLGDGPARLERASRIAADLVRHCVVADPAPNGRAVLLPGAQGFQRPEGLVVNPSYYMPRALRDLGQACGQPLLVRAADSGEAMIDELAARGPVPDWVLLTATGIRPPPQPFSGVSGYEAVRSPLFAMWSAKGSSAVVRDYVQRLQSAGDEGGTPTVFEPDGRGVFERSQHPGYTAVAALAACACTEDVGSLIPAFTADQPYYPATLHMMALVIQVTTYPRCVPI